MIKVELETELASIKQKLDEVNNSLKKKLTIKENYDMALQESEDAYMKVNE